MKSLLLSTLLATALFCLTNATQPQCKLTRAEIPKEWRNMVDTCITKMENQVQRELEAAMTYLAMGAHFSRDTINRPGFAKMFFESASEEREHAIKIMEYLIMRGELASKKTEDHLANEEPKLSSLIRDPHPIATEWDSGVHALKAALELETSVTKNINDIIKECESPASTNPANDYHLVDYLTGEFLEEQYKGQKDLASKASTLQKMMQSHGALGEWLFDKKLLNGELL